MRPFNYFRLMKTRSRHIAIAALATVGVLIATKFVSDARAQTSGPVRTPAPARAVNIRALPVGPATASVGSAAAVVSEVTVKKVIETRELDRIKAALSDVDKRAYRIETVETTDGQEARRKVAGTLPANRVKDLARVREEIKGGELAAVVSSVTVKKIIETKELERIREALAQVPVSERKLVATQTATVAFDPDKGIPQPGFDPSVAAVVSEVTVKKIIETKELDRIKTALAATNPGLYRITAIEKTADGSSAQIEYGALDMAAVAPLRAQQARIPANVAAVVSEITVKKVIETKELQRIRDALSQVPAAEKQVIAREVASPKQL